MTKKPLNPLEDPPTASSSEDDELETSADEEEEEEEVSSEEEDESKDPIKKKTSDSVTISLPGKSTTVSSATAAGDKAGSDSDSGSETETDSDSETERAPNPPNSGSGKAIAVSAVKKKEDPPSLATLALPAVKSVTKRPASEGTSSKDVTKRAKKVTSGEEESIKKPAFQRLWSEEDEIAVLQGMIDFKGDTGKSPYEDTNGFYEFIKKSISFEVSKNQFMDKIRSLKKKYMGKEVKNGVEPSFLKAHDRKAYELSKVIWGPDGIAIESNGVAKKSQSQSKSKSKKLDSVKQELVFGGASSPNGKKVEEDDDKMLIDGGGGDLRKSDWFEKSFLVRAIAGFGVGEFSVKDKWSLVAVENKKMVEEKLKLLQDKEFEFVLEKTDFLHEVTSMIAEASKKNK
ncbi:putative transcription factor [Cardamine amara subsp. amara]|uniref:Transcription factor n=1 Tax=Cardamine amara subsp. amara TaxID=228776 RepID=A0ABD0ZYK8_CARAN